MHNEKERNAKALLITNDKAKALAGFLQEPLLFNISTFYSEAKLHFALRYNERRGLLLSNPFQIYNH